MGCIECIPSRRICIMLSMWTWTSWKIYSQHCALLLIYVEIIISQVCKLRCFTNLNEAKLLCSLCYGGKFVVFWFNTKTGEWIAHLMKNVGLLQLSYLFENCAFYFTSEKTENLRHLLSVIWNSNLKYFRNRIRFLRTFIHLLKMFSEILNLCKRK